MREAAPGPSCLGSAVQWARRELPALFWVFVICSVAGLVLEEAYHLVVFREAESRAGLLFGPFSPIYGVGGVCMFCLARPLRRFPLPVAFLALDVALTLASFNCWYLRASGCAPQTMTQVVCEMAFDDAFMEQRFASISLDPETAGRG